MLQESELPSYLKKRRNLLRSIQTGSLEDALRSWRPDLQDWAILVAFASRRDLPFELIRILCGRRDWLITFVLCHNPGLPLLILREFAQIHSTEKVPSLHDDLEERDREGKRVYDASEIRFIARSVLRQRFAGRK